MTPSSLMLMFTSGETVEAQHCITLTALDDTLYEEDETFNVALIAASPSDEESVRFTAGENVTTVTISSDPNDSMYACLAYIQSLALLP